MVSLVVRANNAVGVFEPAPPPPGNVIARLPFSDGFESGNLSAWNSVGNIVTVTTLEAFEGVRSAMTEAFVGQQSDNYLEFNFGDHVGVAGTPTGMNDLWIRFAHKWASNYVDTDPAIIGQKLLLINSQNPVSNRRRYQNTFNIARATGLYFFDIYRWNEDTSFGGTLHNITVPGFVRVLGRWEEFVFRMRQNNPGLVDGQLQCWTKAEGDTGYVERLNLTNLNYRDATNITPNRLIGLSNYDTITTRSGRRYWDSITLQQEVIPTPPPVVVPPPPGGNTGQIGSYANLNMATHPIYSVDMALADYHLFATQASPFPVTGNGGLAGSGSHSHNASGWWDGGAFCRIIPPSTDQYERSINIANLHRNGTLAIRDFVLRFEQRFSPTIASLFQQQGSGCKWALIQFAPTLGGAGNTSGRPVYFIQPSTFADGAQHRRNNTMAFAPSANTLPAYGDSVYDENHVDQGGTNTYYVNGPQACYLVDSSDNIVTFLNKPIFRGGEFLTIEYRMQSVASAQYPRGLIAMRITNRAGTMIERGIPWNYQNFFAMNQFLDGVSQFGCGQFNVAMPSGAYFDIGGLFTVARDFNGWLGTRNGFIQ